MSLAYVDRALTEALRKKVVEFQRFPDVTQHSTPEQMETAKATLVANTPDKQLIEVFGVGNSDSRSEKLYNRIIVDRVGLKESPKSFIGQHRYERNANDTFTKYEISPNLFDIDYEVRIISNSVKLDREIHTIVFSALPVKKYVKFVDDNGQDKDQGFWLDFTGNVDLVKEKFIERIFRYTARNVFITEDTVVSNNIPQLVEVTANVIPTPFETNFENEAELNALSEDEEIKVTLKVNN